LFVFLVIRIISVKQKMSWATRYYFSSWINIF
jgi:hypothetical protein